MPIDPTTGAFIPGSATGFPTNTMGIPGVAAGSTPGNLGPLQARRGGIPQPVGMQQSMNPQQAMMAQALMRQMGSPAQQMGGMGQMGGGMGSQAQPGIPTPAQQQLMQGIMSRPPGT